MGREWCWVYAEFGEYWPSDGFARAMDSTSAGQALSVSALAITLVD